MTSNKLAPDVDYGFATYMVCNSFDPGNSLNDIEGIEKAVLEIEKHEYYPSYVQINEMLEPKDMKYGERGSVEAFEYKAIKPYSQRSDLPGHRNEMKSFFLLDDIVNIPVWDEDILLEQPIFFIDEGVLYLEIPDFLYEENPGMWDQLAYKIKKAVEPKEK